MKQTLLETGVLYPEMPIKTNPVVDNQAIITDPQHPNFVPQNRTEFIVAVTHLLDVHPYADVQTIYKKIAKEITKEDEQQTDAKGANTDMSDKKVEAVIRKMVQSVLAEAPKSAKHGNPFFNQKVDKDYKPGNPDWEKDVGQLRQSLQKIKVGAEDDEALASTTGKRVRGTKDEQAQQILQALKDEFGIDMSAAQFQNFDKGTKFRWFATAVLTQEEPGFLDRVVDEYVEFLETSAKETGVLDDELRSELRELPDLLRADPSASPAFSEYVQSEVQSYIDSLSPKQLENLADRAEVFFTGVPGGITKYTRKGAKPGEEDLEDDSETPEKEMIKDPEYLRMMSQRRQGSKRFSGGGSPKTGGGSAEERFLAALDNPKVPAEE